MTDPTNSVAAAVAVPESTPALATSATAAALQVNVETHSPLRRVLRKGLADLKRQRNGAELYGAIEQQATEQFQAFDAAGPSPAQESELGLLAGRIYDGERLACLIRGAVAVSIEAATGDNKEMLLVSRMLRHLPGWVLESGAERTERISAENEGKRGRGVRPGAEARARAGGTALYGEDGSATRAAQAGNAPQQPPPAQPARRPEPDEDETDDADDELMSWSPELSEAEAAENAKLWRGHDPQYASDFAIYRPGMKDYLQHCLRLDPLDVMLLDFDLLDSGRDLSQYSFEDLQSRAKRLWRAIATNTWSEARGLRDWRNGRPLDDLTAVQRLRQLRHIQE